jgi:ferredoxin
MAAKWGVFLCNCHQTVAIDPQRLDLPTPYVQLASHPDTDLQSFAALAKRERLDRVLISCCAAPALFDDAFSITGPEAPKVHFVNLKEPCFWAHPDVEQAHVKASRLLRAAVRTVERQTEAVFHPLSAGGRILIATDTPLGQHLAARLQDVARPFLVLTPQVEAFDATLPWRTYRGRVIEVGGRLGEFHVTIENLARSETPHRELQADQVVLIASHGAFPVKARTGCHLLIKPHEAEIDDLAERIRDLIGDFLKTVHVHYYADVCAGGTADQEACGVCIPACPYDAISRSRTNHLRMAVDHMACEGCGACVSACPTSALRFTEPSPHELYARLAALLEPLPGRSPGEPQVILFHCGEQGRRVLEEAGRRPLPYPANVLPVEVPCLRYVSEANMLAALRLGAAGVGLLGCETCQHGERELLYQKLDFGRLTLNAFDLGSERLRLITVDHGTETEAMTAVSRFAATLEATPIQWDGQPLRHLGNRQVIADAIATFIDQSGQEPGRRSFHAPHPCAFVEVRADGCTLCRACVNVCPVHAFKLEEQTSSLQYKHLACIACGLCETVCPEHVINLRREMYFERAALDYQTVVQDDMVACARCGKPYINRKALEAVEARVLSLESLLDTFSGQRQTLLRMCPDCRAIAAMLEIEKGWEP